MEVVAGVSGVAGIVGLVGQSISGTLKLKKLIRGISAAPETLKSSNFLEHDPIAIQNFIRETPEDTSVDTVNDLGTLALLAENCWHDIHGWAKEATKMNPNSSGSVNPFFKRIRIASDVGAMSEFHRKVTGHKQKLSLNLDLFGRWLDISSHKQGVVLAEKLDDFATAQQSFNDRLMQSFDARTFPYGNVLENVSSQQSSVSNQLD
ncbi:hypothetical protein OEA41_005999 [Lepraria neglecta]|uniref:Uncharacterized protein n=1 Tax=Lepraria neglecta TaxID=209136 RepID=A0AAE0DKK2_9LECA|nr:hypothetical protein OEA41_005999 [Lepraria neglecta]